MSDEKRQEAWQAAWGKAGYVLPPPVRPSFFDWGYDAARAEPDGLREALRFYADEANHVHGAAPSAVDFDEGRKARRALGVADRQADPHEYEGYGHAMRDTERVADSPPEEPSDAD